MEAERPVTEIKFGIKQFLGRIEKKRFLFFLAVLYAPLMAVSPRPVMSYLQYPFEGIYFYLYSFVFLIPFFRIIFIELKTFSNLPRLITSLLISIGIIGFLSCVGLYFGKWPALVFFMFIYTCALCYRNDILFFDFLKNYSFEKWELLTLFCSIILGAGYFLPYLLQYGQVIPDADSASTAHLSLMIRHGFPSAINSLPVTLTPNGPAYSTTHIFNPPFIGAQTSFLGLLTGLDVGRVLFWSWIFTPILFFISGMCLIEHLVEKLKLEKCFIYLIPGLIFLMHNNQIHLAYVGGEINELLAFSFIILSLLLAKHQHPIISAFALGYSINLQPDISFPWALGVFIYLFFTYQRSIFLKYLATFFICLAPFIFQQLYFKFSGFPSTLQFLRAFQILVHPYEVFGQFKWYLALYVPLFLAQLLPQFPNKKFFHIMSLTFLFFTFYPWAIHGLYPAGSTLNPGFVYPFKTVGLFTDVLFPFTGKYYYYRQGISWYLTLFSALSLATVIYLIPVRFKKSLAILATFLITIVTLKSFLYEVRYFKGLTPQEAVKSLSYFASHYQIKGPVLTSPANQKYLKEHYYHNWWVGPILNVVAEYSRSQSLKTDMFVNKKYSDTSFADSFWDSFYQKPVDLNLQKQNLTTALKFYSHLVVQRDSTQICQQILNHHVWVFVETKGPYCLFRKPFWWDRPK